MEFLPSPGGAPYIPRLRILPDAAWRMGLDRARPQSWPARDNTYTRVFVALHGLTYVKALTAAWQVS
jgi:hypothetical protein